MNDVIERILVTEEEIIKRSKELGAVITQDYRRCGQDPDRRRTAEGKRAVPR